MLKKNQNFRAMNCILVLMPVIILLVTTIAAQDYLIPFVQGQSPAETAGSVNETGTTLSVEPLIVITSPTNGSQIPAGKVLVSGNASDAAVANIQTIGVKIDDGEYTPATPGVNRSTWSITLDMAPGPHTLKARVDYGAGEQTWSIGNVLVNATSNAQATSNATSSENQISETLPQLPSTQREVQAGSTDNQEASDGSGDGVGDDGGNDGAGGGDNNDGDNGNDGAGGGDNNDGDN